MRELISEKEALIALANGDEVEYYKHEWMDVNRLSVRDLTSSDSMYKFRLKPKTINLNGIEVPAPFEPKDGEKYYYISFEFEYGYSSWNELGCHLGGAWRTEAEIKQVASALRSIFKGE